MISGCMAAPWGVSPRIHFKSRSQNGSPTASPGPEKLNPLPNLPRPPIRPDAAGLAPRGGFAYNGGMEVSSVASPVQGIQRAFARNAQRAGRLADPQGDPQLDKDMAELPSDQRDVGVQTKVIKAKDQMLGDLLDILA